MTVRICGTRSWKERRSRALGRPIERPGALVSGPLFSGSVYLANLVFSTKSGPQTVAAADLAVVQRYLERSVGPISAYASQYGPQRLGAGAPLAAKVVPVPSGEYSDADLQGWVNALASEQHLAPSSAVLVLNPPGVVNTDAKESGGVGVLGYHGLANLPYSFVNVLGSRFRLADPSDLFAEAVSHEVAEMTVDPRANDSNPEVCDGCGTNCQGAAAFRAYFDAAGHYLTSATAFPPSFPYDFFVSAIARPSDVNDCPAPASACAYPPP